MLLDAAGGVHARHGLLPPHRRGRLLRHAAALDEAEDQAAAAAEAKLKAEAMACAYYPVSEKPEA